MPTGNLSTPKPAPAMGSFVGMSAQDSFAALTRSNWYTYLNELGVPQEDKLIQYATDPNLVSNAMAEASQDVNSSFLRQQESLQRRQALPGMALNAEESKAATRTLGLSKSLADVQAQNKARDQTIARQQSILGSPVPNLGSLG